MKHSVWYLLFFLSALLVFNPASAQIQSDGFNTMTLSSFWTFINPLSDATQDFTGTQARIAVPGVLSHEPLQFGANNAPRIVQEIATPGTDFGNFKIYAKFDDAPSMLYQMIGLFAIQDHLNYVRSELFSDGTSIYPLIWAFADDGSPNPGSPVVGAAITYSSGPLWLQLERVDSTFTLYYTTDTGSGWTTGATTNHTMLVDSLGVYIANTDGSSGPGTAAPAFTAKIDYFTTEDPVVPVQLSSFNATVSGQNRVQLTWRTASETNNYGFNVQKALNAPTNFQTIPNSFVSGHGTTIVPQSYSYTDITSSGQWYYRLEQIDLDGARNYSDPVQVDVVTSVGTTPTAPREFALHQNFPNPFNPSTRIAFDVPRESRVRLEVFNLIGQKIATLLDETRPAGSYNVAFDASALTSGMYMYKLTAGGQVFTRKMILMK